MRAIKFRAWDTEKRQMHDADIIVFLADGSYKVLLGNEKGPLNHVWKPTLMQFTGVKDVNGKEIYEGDIIRVSDFNCVDVVSDESGIGQREIFEDIECEVHYEGSGFTFLSDNHGDIPLDVIDEKKFEIIGNIYQNITGIEL